MPARASSATCSPTGMTSRSSSPPSRPGTASPTDPACATEATVPPVAGALAAERLGARRGDRLRALVADEQLGSQRAAGAEVERRETARARERHVEGDDRRLAAERRPGGGDE